MHHHRWMLGPTLMLAISAGARGQQESSGETTSQDTTSQDTTSQDTTSQDAASQGAGAATTAPAGAPEAKQTDAEEEVAFRIRLVTRPGVEEVVSRREFDTYVKTVRELHQLEDPAQYLKIIVDKILSQRAYKIWFHDRLPELEAEAAKVRRKLDRGVSWERVAKAHSDDKPSGSEGGLLGRITHAGFRYPLEVELFKLKVGDIGGPYVTEWGFEYFKVLSEGGGRGTPTEWLDCAYVLILYQGSADQPKPKRDSLMRAVRLSSIAPDLLSVIPPARRETWPESCGPTERAPLGDPDRALSKSPPQDR